MNKSPKKNNSFTTLRSLFVYAKPYKSKVFIASILAIILAPLNAIIPYLANDMVDNYILKMDLSGLRKMAMLYLFILILITVCRYYFIIITNTLGQNIIMNMRRDVFKKLLSLPISYFDKTAVGTNTTRTVNDLETVNSVFSEGLITIIADILALVMLLIVMFYTSVKLTLICLVSFPLLLVASYIFKEKVKTSFTKVRNEVAKLNAFLQENISGMSIIQMFNAEERSKQKFNDINKQYTQANIDAIFHYAVFFPVVEIISAASLGFMVWWGAKGVLHDEVSIGQLVAFPMFLNRLFQPIRQLADKFNTLQMGIIAGERVLDLINNEKSEIDDGKIIDQSLKADIEFNNVFFEYQKDLHVLKNINFRLAKGKSLAIVGPTGSGKSSIVSLLNRLYPIKSGEISIGDININEFKLDYLRSKISIVLQDVFLFSGSIKDNISMKNENITLDEIKEATGQLGLGEFINSFPENYDYILNERGNNLSLGQAQLISFIRAIVTNPDILILDEATSSIDPHTESLVQQAIEKLIKNRTSITIAHRLTTVQKADFLMYLENGEIKEFGTIEELLAIPDGYYFKLHQRQFHSNASVN